MALAAAPPAPRGMHFPSMDGSSSYSYSPEPNSTSSPSSPSLQKDRDLDPVWRSKRVSNPSTPHRNSSLKPVQASPDGASSAAGESSATYSSITPSQSASQGGLRSNRRDFSPPPQQRRERSSVDGGTRNQQQRQSRVDSIHTSTRRTEGEENELEILDSPSSSNSKNHLSFRNLELASLSTPELHLSSDPLILVEEPHLKRRFDRNEPLAKVGGPSFSPHSRTRSNEPADLNFTSLGAVMNSVTPAGKEGKISIRKKTKTSGGRAKSDALGSTPSPRERKLSINTVTANGGKQSSRKEANGSEISSTGSNVTVAADSAVTSNGSQKSPSPSSGEGNSIRNAASWFKRPRRWSHHSASSSKVAQSPSVSDVASSSEAIQAESAVSYATAGTGTTAFTSSSHDDARTTTSLGVDGGPSTPLAALEKMRSARAFLSSELGRMGEGGILENDRPRLAELALFGLQKDGEASKLNVEPAQEVSKFWHSISDGVLLCLLANHLRPASVEVIDRRDIDWVKANNISRFLRAARDHLGLRSKDICQTLDLTDGTISGLERVVHTILAVRAQSATHSTTPRRPSLSRERRSSKSSSKASPPLTPPDDEEDLEISVATPSDIPFPQDESPNGSPRRPSGSRQSWTKQQHRQLAERTLNAGSNSGGGGGVLFDDSSRKSRRSGEFKSGSRGKGSAITFADAVSPRAFSASGSSAEEDASSRMPYRDRKLSESAISLTGVAEEEGGGEEEEIQSPSRPRLRSPSSPEADRVISISRDLEESERPVSPFTLGTPGAATPMGRSNSQRRISLELGFGSPPLSPGLRALGNNGSTEAFDEFAFPAAGSGSPVRAGPTRRHSARSQHLPSSLNPSRDALAASGSEASGIPSPRLPFPRSVSSNESPNVKRIGRHLSLNAGSTNEFSSASNASSSYAPASPKVGPSRPNYRHMRYSSELHLPTAQAAQRSTGHGSRSEVSNNSLYNSNDDRVGSGIQFPQAPSSSRPRYDSEMGSSVYTNTLGSFTTDDHSSAMTRLSREPSIAPTSKHKLVVVEDGKPNITYQVGNCIGRGQFGSVYRALNLNTGQMVAVKRIKLEGRSEDEVTQLMHEVDLLKSLTHPSVVKYEGLVRGPDVVSIILEYVENGSLLHTLKAFGCFPEKLVASYVVKILEGLNYLHESRVVHCDLKAANILTTKNGNVKLSDFGVSLNLLAAEKIKTEKTDAIGTPNWMAPEVIELKGASTAADIWSLACTVIELFTGKPPYGDMLAMSAMFRIVEDDCPPIPDKCSPALVDFLVKCFNKDPTLRPTAAQLFDHPWLKENWTGHKELRPQDSVPFLRRISADFRKLDMNALAGGIDEQQTMERSSSSPPPMPTIRPDLVGLRAASAPDGGWNLAQPRAHDPNSSSPGVSPPILAVFDEAARYGGHENGLRSPDSALSPAAERSLLGSHDPSVLDLNVISGAEEGKPHAFVKSTFSKAVQCKICKEPVKKHAVLCEECGLVCHARCTGDAPSPCNLRAQLLLLARGRASGEYSRVGSPAPGQPYSPAPSPIPTPSSPLISAASFKLPFGKSKRLSRSSESPTTANLPPPSDPSATPTQTVHPLAPLAAIGKNSGNSAQRKRRISLIPLGRVRSTSPDSREAEMQRAPSLGSMVQGNNHKSARRQSSISYGSISGSSSVSSASAGGILMSKTGSRGSAGTSSGIVLAQGSSNSGHEPRPKPLRRSSGRMVSTPQLGRHLSDDSDGEEVVIVADGINEVRRSRFSANFHFGRSEQALSRISTDSHVVRPQGQITPNANSHGLDRKKSRRTTSKSDCTIV